MRPAGMSSEEEDDYDDMYGYDLGPSEEPVKRQLPVSLSARHSNEMNQILTKDRLFYKLHEAIERNDLEAASEAVNQGASVNESTQSHTTPLIAACKQSSPEMVQFLIDQGANPCNHHELFTPVMACCTSSYLPQEDKVSCLRILLENGAHVNAKDRYWLTALIMASQSGLDVVVQELLQQPSIDVNIQDKDGWTALHYAVMKEHKEIVVRLLNANANTDLVAGFDQQTPLDIALVKNLLDIAKLFGYEPEELPQAPSPARYSDPLETFLLQLPNEMGEGGFSSDVKYIFNGVGLERLFKYLKRVPSLPEFLNITDQELAELGIKLTPSRFKLLRGVHRFHLQPWKRSSIHQVPSGTQVNLDDIICIASNILKHLTITVATLDYIISRVQRGYVEPDKQVTSEMIKVLVSSYEEATQLRTLLVRTKHEVDKTPRLGPRPSDFIGPFPFDFKSPWRGRLRKFLLTTAFGGLIYFAVVRNR